MKHMSFQNTPVVAVIPARSGSKGIKNKNLYKINYKPLIYYTIIAAKNSKFIDYIYLTSDSNTILSYGKKHNINCIKRSYKISNDKSNAVDVMLDITKRINKEIYNANPFFVYLQPTSPLRNSKHINEAFNLLNKYKKNSLVSLTLSKETPFKTFTLDKKNNLKSVFSEKMTNHNRQDLPNTYKANGAIYIFKLSNFLKNKSFPSNGSIPFIMNEIQSLDIDSIADIRKAKQYIKMYKIK